MAKRHPIMKLHSSDDGQFYYTVCGGNGRVETTSETYGTYPTCRRMAISHRDRMGGLAKIKDPFAASLGKPSIY